MAKLSAHGTEVARYVRRRPGSAADGVVERIDTYSFRSDGALLSQTQTRLAATPYNKERLVSSGWRLIWRKGSMPEQVAKVNHLVGLGYAPVSL